MIPQFWRKKAETYLAAGDLPAAEQILNRLPFTWPTTVPRTHIDLLIFQRQFDEALRLLAGVEKEKAVQPVFIAVAHSLLGGLYSFKGETTSAKPWLLQADREIKELRAKGEQSLALILSLTEVEARLGHRDEVERELDATFRDRQKDKWGFPRPEEAAARAYAILGDVDRALPMLERAISQPSQWGLTPAILRLHPTFDSLRNDPRVKKLAGASAPKL